MPRFVQGTFYIKIDLLFYSSGDLESQALELVGTHLDMMTEVEVAGLVEGHKVDVDVGHIDAHHSLTDLDAGTDFL